MYRRETNMEMVIKMYATNLDDKSGPRETMNSNKWRTYETIHTLQTPVLSSERCSTSTKLQMCDSNSNQVLSWARNEACRQA
jgi:hypothetical protein